MKKLSFIVLFSLFSLFSFSQNGGQQSENNVVKVSYVGYSNSTHIFKVTNKINCQLAVKLDRNGSFSSHTLSNLEETLILVTAPQLPQINFKAKRESGAQCQQNPDNGWVELASSIPLPIKFGSITTTRVSPNIIKVTFESEEDNTLKHYNILVSEDGKTFKKAHILFPNGITGNKKYSVLVKL